LDRSSPFTESPTTGKKFSERSFQNTRRSATEHGASPTATSAFRLPPSKYAISPTRLPTPRGIGGGGGGGSRSPRAARGAGRRIDSVPPRTSAMNVARSPRRITLASGRSNRATVMNADRPAQSAYVRSES